MSPDTEKRNAHLKAYETYYQSASSFVERLFLGILIFTIGLFVFLGIYFGTIEPEPQKVLAKLRKKIRAQFLIQEKKKPEPKKIEKPKPKKKPKPIDLSDKPKLAQKEDEKQKVKPKIKKKVRRVYGLRKVYSKGIGAGGSLKDAVIGKLGNTIEKDVDTIKATEEDIKGKVVSVTTVTQMPRVKKTVKPSYTKEMIENNVEGVIRIKILIDVDGKVKKAIPLNDLGYGAAQRAANACFGMLFDPAKRGDEPFATWITLAITFKLLG